MNRKSRLLRLTALRSLLVMVAASCTTWQPATQPLPEVLANTQHIRVTTTDGTRFEMEGGDAGQADSIRVEQDRLVGPVGALTN